MYILYLSAIAIAVAAARSGFGVLVMAWAFPLPSGRSSPARQMGSLAVPSPVRGLRECVGLQTPVGAADEELCVSCSLFSVAGADPIGWPLRALRRENRHAEHGSGRP